jgi:hypothetical protein
MNTFRYNVSTPHPIMPTPTDTAQYEEEHFYVSIHSEDRNVLKYPNSGDFEIEFPRDYYNVSKLDVSELALPINIDTFSTLFNNVFLTFQINEPYNPANPPTPTAPFAVTGLQSIIFAGLNAYIGTDFLIKIEDGFYSVDQITTELTRKMNFAVTRYLEKYIRENNLNLYEEFKDSGGYNDFLVVYHYVSQRLWFGNTSSGFIITNDSDFYTKQELNFNSFCVNSGRFPQFVNWGLPNNLGFTRVPTVSRPSKNNGKDVRFYYGDVVSGDDGYWLTANTSVNPGCIPWYVEAPLKINILGEAYIYLLIDGWNNIDVTYPYNNDAYTRQTNETNGMVEYAYGKIPVGSTPVSLSYCSGFFNPKVFEPPVNKIRKVKVSFYYHSGIKVDFNNMPFSVTFDIVCSRLKRK